MPSPRTRASWYSRQALKSMSSAPSCSRTRRAGCCARSVAAISSARLRACWGGTGHCPSRLVLSAASATAPLMASWSPVRWQLVGRTVMVSPRSSRPGSGRPRARGPGTRAPAGRPSWASDTGWPARARRGPNRRGRRPRGYRGGGGRRRCGVRLRVASTTPPATRARTTTATTAWKPRERRAAAPQVCSLPIDGPHESLPRRQRRCDLTGWAQPGGSRTRQPLWPPKPKEFESTAAGSHGRGSPCTIGIVISGSGSS